LERHEITAFIVVRTIIVQDKISQASRNMLYTVREG